MPKDIDISVVKTQELQRLRAVEAASGAPEGERSALKRIGDSIRYSPALMPWMRAYAEWLTLGCLEPPKVSMRLNKARGFAHAPVSNGQIKLLEARADFAAYVLDLQSGPLERARKRFEAAFPEYVEAHAQALAQARDANDYTAVARIAEPVLDRVMPRKAENAQATQVNITLSPNQLAGVSAAYIAPVMDVEEVVTEATPE